MNSKKLMGMRFALLASISVLFATPTHAHHSFALFDKSKVATLKGVLRKIEWTNPHVYLYLFADAPDGSGPMQYAVECGSPNNLNRLGWKINTVKVGDSVMIKMYPLRDGRPGGLFSTMTLQNGKVINAM